ncbi:MAG: hypothetical protein AAGB16_06480 [Pseudomonadota bacterium]
MRTVSVQHISSPLRAAFTISRGAKTSAETIQVTITESGETGRGECVPYSRYSENIVSVMKQIQGMAKELEAGMSREDLQHALPAGAARCAVDCALWDLEAKMSDIPVWQLADLPEPKPLPTMMTISLASAADMAAAAAATPATLLKVKLGGPEDLYRVAAIHNARPDAQLILDGNEGLDDNSNPLTRFFLDLDGIMGPNDDLDSLRDVIHQLYVNQKEEVYCKYLYSIDEKERALGPNTRRLVLRR